MLLPHYRGEPPFARLQIKARAGCLPYDLLDQYVVPNGEVLDYGCGYGLVSFYLHGDTRRVTGYDPDQRRVAAARKQAGDDGPRFAADLADLPERGFDQLVLMDVLYLLPEPLHDELFARFATLLRPGGRLLVKETLRTASLPYYFVVFEEWVLKLLGRTVGHGIQFRTQSYYLDLAARHGFNVVDIAHRASSINVYEAYDCRLTTSE